MLFQYEPELDAFLEFLIWRFSVWVDKPTPRNALMNLRCRDERVAPQQLVRTGLEGPGLTTPQKIWYCVTSVGGQYFSRLQSFSAFRRCGDSERPRGVASNTVFKSGPLFISSKGLGWTSWKKRWFILTRSSFVFFKNDPATLPQKSGEVNLTLGGIDFKCWQEKQKKVFGLIDYNGKQKIKEEAS